MSDRQHGITCINLQENSATFNSFGDWTVEKVPDLHKQLIPLLPKVSQKGILWDFQQVSNLDSSGIMLIIEAIDTLQASGDVVTCVNMKPEHQRLLIFYRKNYVPRHHPIRSFSEPKQNLLARTGKAALNLFDNFTSFLAFIGETKVAALQILLKPSLFRFKATVKHIEHSGLRALPIIALTAFLIGLVIAYQGADQLQKFGANIFIVEMVSISVFRELAPLVTAIVIAGRSASAYTAEIGTMKITEEIDAMRTMGFHPHHFLVLPRVLGLVISMPLIVFFADIIAMGGGMLIAKYQLGVSYHEFINRLYAEIPLKHLVIGLIKAPFYGLIIALIGCYRGFQVVGSTDSIGNFTTISVVNAVFWVIAINALFSIILTELGI